ncbi:MAG: response regulator [Anaerolineaceae bacterium]|nr:MAG: response regulator [Anaerolineaceae bacterium]
MAAKPLIMIIEDHAYMRDTLIRLVELEGWQAIGVGESRHVLPVIKQYKPQAIILDIDLGEKVTGVDILRYLKANPHYRHIPIILHTSESGISTLPEADLADLILLKPVSPDDIGPLISRVLKKNHA